MTLRQLRAKIDEILNSYGEGHIEAEQELLDCPVNVIIGHKRYPISQLFLSGSGITSLWDEIRLVPSKKEADAPWKEHD